MAAGSNNAPLIVIVGETASGKSELAMQIAEKFDGEIIAADSWTVYKGFDIGTAKPSAEEQASVPHHLLDIADPVAGFNAAEYRRLAKRVIADITGRGKLPVMVGGTGLYIDSVLFDYNFLPPSTPALRRELNGLSLHELLGRADALALNTTGIDLRNKRRVIRLIENNGLRPTKKAMRSNTLIIGRKRQPDELLERIVARIDSMVAHGFADEVRRLGETYGWNCEPMRAPGYRAFTDYVQDRIPLEVAKERVIQSDLQLAKKQRTWFKRNKSIHWISKQAEVVELITTFLNK